MLRAGIVGMPNVGKSTLFNTITNSNVIAENFPFATIAPNTGVVEVPDSRLDDLVVKFNSKKRIPATFEFTDIAGLVKGASKGEGLGNQFLAEIREVDAICHVVRCFDDSEIVHVDGKVDPLRDIETINLELIFADLDTIEKRLGRISKKATTTKDNEAVFEFQLLNKLKDALMKGVAARALNLSKEELGFCKVNLHLLTLKPVIYIANINQDDIVDPSSNKYFQQVKQFASKENNGAIGISVKMEYEISKLSKEDQQKFLADFDIKESGLDQLIKETYNILGLRTFFTAGLPESRAWTFKLGSRAPECAGIIHSDFEKGFIRAEVYAYDDLQTYQSEAQVKEKGKWRLEGKDYIMQDGDIVHFRFNVK